MSENELLNLAKKNKDYKVDMIFDGWPGTVFLDKKYIGNGVHAIVNRKAKFYTHFFSYLDKNKDKKGFEAVQILLLAFIRAEDELGLEVDEEDMVKLREKWGYWIEQLIENAGN